MMAVEFESGVKLPNDVSISSAEGTVNNSALNNSLMT